MTDHGAVNSDAMLLTIDVANELHGFRSLYLYRRLPDIFNSPPFHLKRKTHQEVGTPHELLPDGTKIRFLHEICADLGLPKTGTKEELIGRLVAWLFKSPEAVPDFVVARFDKEQWDRAVKNDSFIDAEMKDVREKFGARSIEVQRFTQLSLSCAYYARKMGLFPVHEQTFLFFDTELSTQCVLECVDRLDKVQLDASLDLWNHSGPVSIVKKTRQGPYKGRAITTPVDGSRYIDMTRPPRKRVRCASSSAGDLIEAQANKNPESFKDYDSRRRADLSFAKELLGAAKDYPGRTTDKLEEAAALLIDSITEGIKKRHTAGFSNQHADGQRSEDGEDSNDEGSDEQQGDDD